jgi:hypothetical protein
MSQQYGKIILAVLGVVLMITFLLPGTMGRSSDSSNYKVGTLNGKKVTQADLNAARAEVGVVASMLRQQGMALEMFLPLDEQNPDLHWYLMLKDAARYGFDTMDSAVEPEQLNAMARQLNLSPEAVQTALSHMQAIIQYRAFVGRMPQPVTAVELAGEQDLAKVQVSYATIDGTGNWEQATAPTDEQIAKQFELYKDVVRAPRAGAAAPPVVNGHTYPFGYKYPDRVSVEYLVIERGALRAKIEPTREDYDEAYRYYREHPDEFKTPSAAGVLTTQPAGKSFDEVKEALVGRQVDARVAREMKRITDRLLTQAGDPWRAVQEGEVVPAEKWPDLQKLADDLARNREYGGYKPAYKATGEAPLGAEGLAGLAGIGEATYRPSAQGGAFGFVDLATHVRELAKLSVRDPLGRQGLQVGAPGPLLTDKDGNQYIYRVTKVDPSHVPASAAEVRGQVVEDLKKLATYEKAVAQAKALAAAAEKGDLARVAADQKVPVAKSPEFSRVGVLPPELQGIHRFAEVAFTLVPPQSAAGSQPAATQGAATQAGVGATTTLADDAALKAYALQLEHVSPASAADFAAQRDYLLQQLTREELDAFASQWLSLDALSARVKFVPKEPRAAKKEGEG